jgi:hypothetical protein
LFVVNAVNNKSDTFLLQTSADEGVVLAQGEGGYQTVTILPPESSSGEVSYVLIVQQPDGAEQAVISSEVLDGTEGEVIQGTVVVWTYLHTTILLSYLTY